MNQQLGGAGYSEQLVTDLGLDMTDGITLLHLVQALGACIIIIFMVHSYVGGLFHFFFHGVVLGFVFLSRVLFYGLSHFDF